MKIKRIGIIIAAAALFLSASLGTARAGSDADLAPARESSAVKLPSASTAPVEFTGGTMIGNVNAETLSDGKIVFNIDGGAGFVFPKGHPGGVLSLKFEQQPENPVAAAEFHQFPLDASPQTLPLNGKPLEIQIAPKQVYLFIALKEPGKLVLSSLKFTSGAALSDSAACKCAQIKFTQPDSFAAPDLSKLHIGK